jgi:tetratricopeptide (TPR) repeat protein
MIVEQHYAEEILISFVGADQDAARDHHLSACKSCAETLRQFRLLADSLTEEAVWEERELDFTPNANTIATLRAFADDMSRDDDDAAPLVASLLATPRETWAGQMAEHPEWRTAGVVRALVAAAQRLIDTMPPDAAAAAAVAVDIAEHLDRLRVGVDVVAKLRGAAWRERAYALAFIGEFKQALTAVETAEAAFADCTVNDYDLSRVAIVRCLTYRSLDRVPETLPIARNAANVFANSGDDRRRCSALMLEAMAAVSLGEYRRAVNLFDAIQRSTSDHDLRARALGNMGNCYRALREIENAFAAYDASAHLHDLHGTHTESARIRWNRAVLLADSGAHAEAVTRLLDVKRQLQQLGMSYDAALAALSAAESLLAISRPAEVVDLAREAIALFQTLGVAYTEKALTALAYLREAAEQGTATPALVTNVRTYIRRLPAEPHLLFAHAPD